MIPELAERIRQRLAEYLAGSGEQGDADLSDGRRRIVVADRVESAAP
jgi:hypothetical protein